jgi:predicted nucleic acid-binding protein
MTATVTNLTYVDASEWIALVNERDSLHNQATQIYQNRLEQHHRVLTSSLVLLEMGNWLSPVPLRRLAIDLLDRIERSAMIEVVHLTPELNARGWDLYRPRSDKDWGSHRLYKLCHNARAQDYRSIDRRSPLSASRVHHPALIDQNHV